ncbi:hypothetical protein TNCV_3581361 [Trichonephila clavipes]|nr:hypothetical protein TNCV_3581361 [Trichonephila clavipes]
MFVNVLVLLRQGGTQNSRRTASPLAKLVSGTEMCYPNHLQCILPQNWGGTGPNRTVTCMVLKATANDPQSDTIRKVEFVTVAQNKVIFPNGFHKRF